MKLTRAAEYAVRCVLHLYDKKGIQCARKDISEQEDIPAHFLAKIGQELKKAEIVDITQGSNGGLTLVTDDPTILEVIEAITGKVMPHPVPRKGEAATGIMAQYARANAMARAGLDVRMSEVG